MSETPPFYLQKGNVFAVPVIHYNMEFSAHVFKVLNHIKPDCIAVELAETMQLQLLHAASRLPDISIVLTFDKLNDPLYYLAEPCDPSFEALRFGLENNIPSFCIDLDVDYYPDIKEHFPDPYAIYRIGLKQYFELYSETNKKHGLPKMKVDMDREHYMAKRLKELSLCYDKVLFITGMSHAESVLELLERSSYPKL